MKKFSTVTWISAILLIIGGLNYGLIGLFNRGYLEGIFGGGGVSRVLYVLIGVAAVWLIIDLIRCRKCCCKSSACSCCSGGDNDKKISGM